MESLIGKQYVPLDGSYSKYVDDETQAYLTQPYEGEILSFEIVTEPYIGEVTYDFVPIVEGSALPHTEIHKFEFVNVLNHRNNRIVRLLFFPEGLDVEESKEYRMKQFKSIENLWHFDKMLKEHNKELYNTDNDSNT